MKQALYLLFCLCFILGCEKEPSPIQISISTGSVTDVTPRSVFVQVSIDHQEMVDEVGVLYCTDSLFTNPIKNCIQDVSGSTYSFKLSNLSSGTRYYYKAYIYGKSHTIYSGIYSFITDGVVNVPDANFKTYLLENFDLNKDNEISIKEASNIEEVRCENGDIFYLDGLEYFSNLKYIDCSYNHVMDVDFSQNLELERVYVSFNNITMLDFSENPKVKVINCSNNRITNLFVDKCGDLETFCCNWNNLIELDVTQNRQLQFFSCWKNQLIKLNISNNNLLEILQCGDNDFDILDTSNNTFLKRIDIQGCNKISSIDFRENQKLEYADCQTYSPCIDIYLKKGQTFKNTLYVLDNAVIHYE